MLTLVVAWRVMRDLTGMLSSCAFEIRAFIALNSMI